MSVNTTTINSDKLPENLINLNEELLSIFIDFVHDYTCKAGNEKGINLNASLAKGLSVDSINDISELIKSIFNTDDLPQCDQDDFEKMGEYLGSVIISNINISAESKEVIQATKVSVDDIINGK